MTQHNDSPKGTVQITMGKKQAQEVKMALILMSEVRKDTGRHLKAGYLDDTIEQINDRTI